MTLLKLMYAVVILAYLTWGVCNVNRRNAEHVNKHDKKANEHVQKKAKKEKPQDYARKP